MLWYTAKQPGDTTAIVIGRCGSRMNAMNMYWKSLLPDAPANQACHAGSENGRNGGTGRATTVFIPEIIMTR